MQSLADITVIVNSEFSSSERRINPSWTISHLKAKLFPITGIPEGSQKLTLRSATRQIPTLIAAEDEDKTMLLGYGLGMYDELHVEDLRPPAARPNFVDTTDVEKYEMPLDQYEKRTDSVLAWKKRNQLGRFDPNKDENEGRELQRQWDEVKEQGIEVGKRCKVGERRGTVRFVGVVEEIPGKGVWVGVEGDEPTGKNDGSIGGKAYFSCKPKYGSFVKADRVEIGDFEELDDLDDLEEL